MKLKKCQACEIYTLKNNCQKCSEKTADAHYKFVKIKDVGLRNKDIIQKDN